MNRNYTVTDEYKNNEKELDDFAQEFANEANKEIINIPYIQKILTFFMKLLRKDV